MKHINKFISKHLRVQRKKVKIVSFVNEVYHKMSVKYSGFTVLLSRDLRGASAPADFLYILPDRRRPEMSSPCTLLCNIAARFMKWCITLQCLSLQYNISEPVRLKRSYDSPTGQYTSIYNILLISQQHLVNILFSE